MDDALGRDDGPRFVMYFKGGGGTRFVTGCKKKRGKSCPKKIA